MDNIAQLIGLLLLSSTKFLFAPSTIVASGYSFWETIAVSIIGGWFGVLTFYYFGVLLVDLFMKKILTPKTTQKKAFSKKNKMIVKTKMKFGIIGLALISPVTISIPIGCILAGRYFGDDKKTVIFLLLSVVFWAFILTAISTQFKALF